jgi:hypothetical protein
MQNECRDTAESTRLRQLPRETPLLAELPFQSLTELSRRLDAGETTSVAIVEACLHNIDALNEKLHAFHEVYREDAMRLA